jgi:hypothetical protein
MSGDILNLVLAAVGIIGGAVVSYWFFRIAKRERLPIYVVTGNEVVRGDENLQIEVRFKGENVPVVTRTVVAFWNAGREPIRGDDIVDSHPPLVMRPHDAQLLEARVIATTRAEIDFECFPGGWHQHGLRVGFSFLNYQDGGAIEILHTGDTWVVQMDGAIVGVDGPPRPFELRREPKILRIVMLGSMFGILALLGVFLVVTTGPTANMPTTLLIALSGLLLLGSGSAALLDILKKPSMEWRRIPEPLREVLGWMPLAYQSLDQADQDQE